MNDTSAQKDTIATEPIELLEARARRNQPKIDTIALDEGVPPPVVDAKGGNADKARAKKKGVKVSNQDINVTANDDANSYTFLLKSELDEEASVVISNTYGETVKGFLVMTNTPTVFLFNGKRGKYIITAISATTKYEAKLVITK